MVYNKDQDQEYTLKLDTRTAFCILKTPTKFYFDSKTSSKDIESSGRQTDGRRLENAFLSFRDVKTDHFFLFLMITMRYLFRYSVYHKNVTKNAIGLIEEMTHPKSLRKCCCPLNSQNK